MTALHCHRVQLRVNAPVSWLAAQSDSNVAVCQQIRARLAYIVGVIDSSLLLQC